MKFCFVILHYMAAHCTRECIESILSLYGGSDISILIIDNASPDGSGIELKNEYVADGRIDVIINSENLGFAKANNLGASLCRERFNPDFIVFCNNDIVFNDADFLPQIGELFDSKSFDVLGPDIVLSDGTHQSPLHTSRIPLSYMKKVYFKSRLKVFVMKTGGIVEKLYGVYRKEYLKHEVLPVCESAKSSDTCVLSGSCMIFSKKYINTHDSIFCPDTFMYFEESILRDIIDSEGGTMIYSPLLHVLHKHGESTHSAYSDKRKHSLFIAEQYVKSLKAAIRIRKSRGFNE